MELFLINYIFTFFYSLFVSIGEVDKYELK